MDVHPSEDMYDSFRKYQTALLAQFDKLAQEYSFEVVDASADIRTIFGRLREGIARVLSGEPREPLFAVTAPAVEAGQAPTANIIEMPSASTSEAAQKAQQESGSQALAKAAEGDANK